MRNTLSVGKLAVTGYCFGGRYSFRFVDAARTVKADVAFAAHPSAWVDGEVSAIGAATAVATAGKLPPHLIPCQGPNAMAGAGLGFLKYCPVMTRANCDTYTWESV
jgi:dienelactone hydrolase